MPQPSFPRVCSTVSKLSDLKVLWLQLLILVVCTLHGHVWIFAVSHCGSWPVFRVTLFQFASLPLHLHEVPTVSSRSYPST